VAQSGTRPRVVDYLAAAGVVLGLVFVGLELRQNTTAMRGAAYQELAAASGANALTIATDPQLADVIVRWFEEPQSLTRAEALQIRMVILMAGRQTENAFQQYRVGTMDGDLWQGYVEAFRLWTNAPGFAEVWETYQYRFSTAFRAYADTALVGVPGPGVPR
jgi:hypothetical protein